MKKLILSLIFFCSLGLAQAQDNRAIIELGKVYSSYMGIDEIPNSRVEELSRSVAGNLRVAKDFVVETGKVNNQLVSSKYLALPDSATLKEIYLIRYVSRNVNKGESTISALLENLRRKNVPRVELVSVYYNMLFNSLRNKMKPFDLSDFDFILSEYNLQDYKEESIFYLECMNVLAGKVWEQMNLTQVANTVGAYNDISKFPRFDGMKYYQFTSFYFPDFQMELIPGEGPQSYKGYYVRNVYELLVSHMVCLKAGTGTQEELGSLMSESLLSESNPYRFMQ